MAQRPAIVGRRGSQRRVRGNDSPRNAPGNIVLDHEVVTHIYNDLDIVTARSAVREVARSLGFGTIDQARIATAVSEVARMIFLQAGKGQVIAREIEQHGRRGIEIECHAQSSAFAGQPATVGPTPGELPGVRRLVDDYVVRSQAGQTVIVCRKWCA